MASEEAARLSGSRPERGGERDGKPPIALMREPGVIQRIVCAVFAWAVTIAPYVLGRTGSWAGRLVAVVALAAGVAGPLLVPGRRRIGRHVGITGFLGLSPLVWLLSGKAIAIQRLDPILATIGALAWGVFAFSWGEPWRTRDEAQQTDELGGMLRARAQLPPLAVPIAAIGVLAGLGLRPAPSSPRLPVSGSGSPSSPPPPTSRLAAASRGLPRRPCLAPPAAPSSCSSSRPCSAAGS